MLLFLNTARSYGFENVTIDEEMLWANLVERGATNSKVKDHKSHLHIVAVGDVHGNLDNLKKVLYMAGSRMRPVIGKNLVLLIRVRNGNNLQIF